jgi:hypothetical protein
MVIEGGAPFVTSPHPQSDAAKSQADATINERIEFSQDNEAE